MNIAGPELLTWSFLTVTSALLALMGFIYLRPGARCSRAHVVNRGEGAVRDRHGTDRAAGIGADRPRHRSLHLFRGGRSRPPSAKQVPTSLPPPRADRAASDRKPLKFSLWSNQMGSRRYSRSGSGRSRLHSGRRHLGDAAGGVRRSARCLDCHPRARTPTRVPPFRRRLLQD